VEDQVADLVKVLVEVLLEVLVEVLLEVLLEVLVVDREEGDRSRMGVDLDRVYLEEVDPEEDHIHPVMGLEQVARPCGVEEVSLADDTGTHMGCCHQIHEVYHDYRGQSNHYRRG
jgi:hypothetical protein